MPKGLLIGCLNGGQVEAEDRMLDPLLLQLAQRKPVKEVATPLS